jgi:hypothetical protein
MLQIETNQKDIFRFDGVMPNRVCDLLVEYVFNIKGRSKTIDVNKYVEPWNQGDSLHWSSIQNEYLFAKVESFRELCNYLVSVCSGLHTYPFYADIVVWRENSYMIKHVDDGSKTPENKNNMHFSPRKYSLVAYLNDNFTGGETYIESQNNTYISYPKKGSIVIFKSNLEHGVNKITSGTRVTFPMWFTDQKDKQEFYIQR